MESAGGKAGPLAPTHQVLILQTHHAVLNEKHFFWLGKGPLLVGPIDLSVGQLLCPFM